MHPLTLAMVHQLIILDAAAKKKVAAAVKPKDGLSN